jgi:hypothetical protein
LDSLACTVCDSGAYCTGSGGSEGVAGIAPTVHFSKRFRRSSTFFQTIPSLRSRCGTSRGETTGEEGRAKEEEGEEKEEEENEARAARRITRVLLHRHPGTAARCMIPSWHGSLQSRIGRKNRYGNEQCSGTCYRGSTPLFCMWHMVASLDMDGRKRCQ